MKNLVKRIEVLPKTVIFHRLNGSEQYYKPWLSDASIKRLNSVIKGKVVRSWGTSQGHFEYTLEYSQNDDTNS